MKKIILFLFLGYALISINWGCEDIQPILEDVCSITEQICLYSEQICALLPKEKEVNKIEKVHLVQIRSVLEQQVEIVKAGVEKVDSEKLQEIKSELVKVRDELKKQYQSLKKDTTKEKQ